MLCCVQFGMVESSRRVEEKPKWAQLLVGARKRRFESSADAARSFNVAASAYRSWEAGHYKPRLLESLPTVFPDQAEEIIEALAADGLVVGSQALFRDGREALPKVLVTALLDANVTRFHPNRDYYRHERAGSGSISDYVSTATQSVEMVSINLATGNDLETITVAFEELISKLRNPVRVTVSLLDPEKPYLLECIARVIRKSPEALANQINVTIEALSDFRDRKLAEARKSLLEVWCHAWLPHDSAIILDGDSPNGRFQLETKGYQLGMQKSFGFEVGAGSQFFTDLRDSYRGLIHDGRRVF